LDKSSFQGERIDPDDHQARRRVAGYLVHPPIALERLRYRPETRQVIYYGRPRGPCGDAEGSPARIFPALDFLAALCTHVPDSGQQLVRYYGAFSNARRVSPRPPASASAPPAGAQGMHPDGCDSGGEFARGRRRSWARLIKKVYEADPLVCPRCSGPLKIISLIGDGPVIEKILRHLMLWDRPERPPPRPAPRSIHYDEEIVDRDEAGRNPLRRSRLLCAQDPGPCLGGSLPEIGAGAGKGSGPGRPAPLPLPISPSCGPAFMDAAVSSREIGDISGMFPGHVRPPDPPPPKQFPIIPSSSSVLL